MGSLMIANFRCKKSRDVIVSFLVMKQTTLQKISGWSLILNQKDWGLFHEKSTH